MAWCISEFGRDEMLQIAIEEWAAASPIYTRRMQQRSAMRPQYRQGDVVTIFKGLQLDIGAPRSSWTSATPCTTRSTASSSSTTAAR